MPAFNNESYENHKVQFKLSKNDYEKLLNIRAEIKNCFKARFPKFLYPGSIEMGSLILFNKSDEVKYIVFIFANDSHKDDELECNANVRAQLKMDFTLFNNSMHFQCCLILVYLLK